MQNNLKPIHQVDITKQTQTTYSATPTQTSSTSNSTYKAEATVYFYKRLEQIYGAMFRSLFKTPDQLLESQKEWSDQIGRLTRKGIDHGMEKLKPLIASNNDFKWPNIAKTIGLCTTQPAHPSHRLFEQGLCLPEKAQEEMIQKRNEVGGKAIDGIRRNLKVVKRRTNREILAVTPGEGEARSKQQKQLLEQAKGHYHGIKPNGNNQH